MYLNSPQFLADFANEKSTFVVNVVLKDELDVVIAPKTLSWGLYDNTGNVINSRSNVAITTPTSSNDIVLSGDDLGITGTALSEQRILQLVGTYDSIHGNDLPIRQEYRFYVRNLQGTI